MMKCAVRAAERSAGERLDLSRAPRWWSGGENVFSESECWLLAVMSHHPRQPVRLWDTRRVLISKRLNRSSVTPVYQQQLNWYLSYTRSSTGPEQPSTEWKSCACLTHPSIPDVLPVLFIINLHASFCFLEGQAWSFLICCHVIWTIQTSEIFRFRSAFRPWSQN